jgi:peptidoglycan/xylan/chitin deacetylase (PgdA/CDA1 family)
MPGIFTISLDFELHWGVFDKKNREEREACYKNTLQVIPKMLELFSHYNVHVTWACVGSLFAKNEEEWKKLKPEIEPLYTLEKYSPYSWVKENGLSDSYSWAHFAPHIISQILQYPGQELASHTFSHYYCLEQQKKEDAFVADIEAMEKAASMFGAKISSLVFPRNQFNEKYLKKCFEYGILAVRSNPNSWYWEPVNSSGSSIIRKIVRTADAYIHIGQPRSSYPLASIKVNEGESLQLPASRFLRPWRNKYKFANKLRLNRLCQEIRTAAIKKECYHLWWHPENFGDNPSENLATLSTLLKEYKKCNQRFGMESWHMRDYADHLLGLEKNTQQYANQASQ